MDLEIKSKEPVYGENYKKGYIGFTYFKKSFISNGIAYITRWARMSDIMVSHALVVTGENTCVEALIDKGVIETHLTDYFENPECQIFFRKPVGLTNQIADSIALLAEGQLGTKYNHKLIVAQAMQGTFIGKLINKVFNNNPDILASKLLNRDDKWICSELAAYCLDEQEKYRNKGVLRHSNETIDPQELFEDDLIFQKWRN